MRTIFICLLCFFAAISPFRAHANTLVEEAIVLPAITHVSIDLTQQDASLWARIRNGFAMQDIEDDLTLKHQEFYLNNPAYLKRMVARARPFLFHIVEEIEKRNMPTELAFLPMVESAFNPNAYSRAKASGLWQFIPSTGKRFYLEQNYWVDERRDIAASTEAALSYLQNIYDMHGDWHLALASYNWGEGAVGRAVLKNEGLDLPTDYLNLKVPNETRHYVPKLQALKNIFGDPFLLQYLGIDDIPNRPIVASVQIKEPMDLKTAAALAGLSVDDFQRFNPAHNRAVVMSDSEVLLPADKIDAFLLNIENYEGPLNKLFVVRLKENTSLKQFAAANKLSLAGLADINGVPQKASIRAGSALLVPREVKGAKTLDAFLEEHGTPELKIKVAQKKKAKKSKKSKKHKKRAVKKTIAKKS